MPNFNIMKQYVEVKGAGKNHNGCDAIQTNMTNSRSTDPEIFEEEYPIILSEISLVGGKGKLIVFTQVAVV